MPFRFHRSVKILPGVRLNISKTGIGVSAGVRGFHVGRDARGKSYLSAGIPGTGISYRKTLQSKPGAPDHSVHQEHSPGSTARIWLGVAFAAIVAAILTVLSINR